MHEPWNLWGTKTVFDLEDSLCEVPEDDNLLKEHIVLELILLMERLECLSESMVRGVLQAQSR
jgi:hypothetical protein